MKSLSSYEFIRKFQNMFYQYSTKKACWSTIVIFYTLFLYLQTGTALLQFPSDWQVKEASPTNSKPSWQENDKFEDIANTSPLGDSRMPLNCIVCRSGHVAGLQESLPNVQLNWPFNPQRTSSPPATFTKPVLHVTVAFIPNWSIFGLCSFTKIEFGGRTTGW